MIILLRVLELLTPISLGVLTYFWWHDRQVFTTQLNSLKLEVDSLAKGDPVPISTPVTTGLEDILKIIQTLGTSVKKLEEAAANQKPIVTPPSAIRKK